jgi:D-alanine-D-alanine ligase
MSLKKTVAIVYGGKSTEHEISCRSAAFLFRHMPLDRYELAALAVNKEGKLLPQNINRIQQEKAVVVRIDETEQPDPHSKKIAERLIAFLNGQQSRQKNDDIIIFSIMHGTYGEDGCWQGFWELAQVPYVGPDLLGSAIAMDKVVAKKLVQLENIPVVDYVTVHLAEWLEDQDEVLGKIQAHLSDGPYFVKPASLGSSVGANQARKREDLIKALKEALSFDVKVLVEKNVEIREIEFAVLGGDKVRVSLPGEVAASSGFYSYESKYVDANDAKILIPAPIDQKLIEEGRDLAARIFRALNLYGLARIDLFLEKSTQRFYFNEANTLPGFTSISQYPMLWQHMGIGPAELLRELVEIALQRFQQKNTLQRNL